MTATDRPALGIALRVLSGVFATGMFICVKAVSETVPLGEIVFFRAIFALPPLILFLWLRGEFPGGLATRRPLDHLMRAGFGAIALFGYFASLARLSLAEAVLIAQLSPVLMAAAAVVMLRERPTVWRLGGLLLGFAGVLALVWPELGACGDGARLSGYVIGLAAAGFTALALVMVRGLNRTESPGAIAWWFVIASAAGALVTLPLGWIVPDASTLVFLVAAGLFGGCAHIAMTLAFRYAEASRLAPFEYMALLWPVAADLVIFDLPLSTSFLAAAPLVLAGAAFAAMEKRKGP